MKATDSPDIFPQQEFKDRVKALGFSDEECNSMIHLALTLGLFSLAVGRGGVACYSAEKWGEAARSLGVKRAGMDWYISILIPDQEPMDMTPEDCLEEDEELE